MEGTTTATSSEGNKRNGAWWDVETAAPDPIFGVAAACAADTRKDKVDLAVGAYRDSEGRPWVLPCVRRAEGLLMMQNDKEGNNEGASLPDHEYLPVGGLAAFNAGAREAALGAPGVCCAADCVATVQTLSGTGALRLAAELLARWPRGTRAVHVPAPTWANHAAVFGAAGLAVQRYPYWDAAARTVDVAGVLKAVRSAPPRSVFLFHACAHNPTGADPAPTDWARICAACRARAHTVVFDAAYQGLASGDAERDALAMRLFVREQYKDMKKQNNFEEQEQEPLPPGGLLICQSFAKTLGLYGERVGALHVVCADAEEAGRVRSQVLAAARALYSSPPAWGARLASTVFAHAELRAQWAADVRHMAQRLADMRAALVAALQRADKGAAPQRWAHIARQTGMFAYTGLSPRQCAALAREHAVYLTANGRLSLAGLNPANVDRVAQAIHSVTVDYPEVPETEA